MSVLGYTNLLTSNSMPTTVLIATGATRGNVANVSKTFNSLTANVIIVALAYNNLGGFGILSDNLGNTYTMYNAYGGSQVFVRFFVCLNPITSATHTITYNSTNTAPGMAILVDKRSRTPIMDYFNVGFAPYPTSGAISSIQPGSITPSAKGNLIVAAICTGTGGTPPDTIGFPVGWTSYGIGRTAGTNQGVYLGFIVQTIPAAINPTITSTNASIYGATIISIK